MDLEQKAIERIRMASETSQAQYEKPLIITMSGGKDSDVCVELARRSGVPFEVQHSHTTADAPQTVYHIRKQFKKLEEQGICCQVNYPIYHGQRVTMWSLIPQKLMPPTRTVRYCCDILKEQVGKDRVITTGVRRDESAQRSTRGALELLGKTKKGLIVFEDVEDKAQVDQTVLGEIFLNNDNDPRRKSIEHCQTKGKFVCNPIIDWTTHDVWGFIYSEKLEVNSLYQCGFNRVGCIGCPLASTKARYEQFRKFPKYEQIYLHAFANMIEVRTRQGKGTTVWKSAEAVFRWWMDDQNLDGQMKWEV